MDDGTYLHLATRFGTPLYVYDLQTLRQSVRELRKIVPYDYELLYSVKANPHPRIVEEAAAEGCGAEISSIGELRVALGAGVSPEKMQVTGPGKSELFYQLAIEANCGTYSVESPQDLHRLNSVARDFRQHVDALIRVNIDAAIVGGRLNMAGRATQFGTDLKALLEGTPVFMPTKHVSLVGLHFFSASNVSGASNLLTLFAQCLKSAHELRRHGYKTDLVNLGGGFPAPFGRDEEPELSGLATGELPGLLKRSDLSSGGVASVRFEAGRAVAARCGILICRVLDVKWSKDERFVIVDSGSNHLAGSNFSRLHGQSAVLPCVLSREGKYQGLEDSLATIVGPLCTPTDRLATRISLPDVQVGDLIKVPNVGAYGLSAGLMGFLSHPAPVEVVIDGSSLLSASRISLARTPMNLPVDR